MPQQRSISWLVLSIFESGMSSADGVVSVVMGGISLPGSISTVSLACITTMLSYGFSLCVIYLQERRMREILTYGATRVQKAIE